jgi:hypothetical protein
MVLDLVFRDGVHHTDPVVAIYVDGKDDLGLGHDLIAGVLQGLAIVGMEQWCHAECQEAAAMPGLGGSGTQVLYLTCS